MTRKDIFNIDVDENGYPVNKDYLEANLPDTLQRGIDELNACDNLCRIDLYQDELYGDITVENAELDDMILIKSDGYPTYNFANVVDEVARYLRKKYLSSDYIPIAMRKKSQEE